MRHRVMESHPESTAQMIRNQSPLVRTLCLGQLHVSQEQELLFRHWRYVHASVLVYDG